MAENIFITTDLQKVAYDPVKWENGSTPLDEKNLNNSDNALNDLLGFNSENDKGYIFQIVDKVKSTEGDLSKLKGENLPADVSVNSVYKTTTKLTTDLSSIKTDVTEVEGSVDALQKTVNNLQGGALDQGVTVKSLDSRIDTLENRINNLPTGNLDNCILNGDKIIINCGNAQNLI